VDEDGQDIARGLTNYNAEEARRIAGHASQKIETLLGYGGDAAIRGHAIRHDTGSAIRGLALTHPLS
jgi:glutamate 5-kinase